ncbi:MAG: DinB family protein [Bacteroidota bacterium]
MSLAKSFIAELNSEAPVTRKILALVPTDQKVYKIHHKSMELGRLAKHVAELPTWITFSIKSNELDFSKGWTPSPDFNSGEELVAQFDKNVAEAIEALSTATDEQLEQPWTLRNGETIYFTMPKKTVIRSMAFNHFIHHRAQLGVYLRLLDIPIPGAYGPSADDKM